MWIRYADFFSRPLRLTPEQALGLVAAGSSLAIPGADSGRPLAQGPGEAGSDPRHRRGRRHRRRPWAKRRWKPWRPPAGGPRGRQVEIDYYAYGRDERPTGPSIRGGCTPTGGVVRRGWCHQAEESGSPGRPHPGASLLDATFDAPGEPPELGALLPTRADDPRLTLELDAEARWVLEQYPVRQSRTWAGAAGSGWPCRPSPGWSACCCGSAACDRGRVHGRSASRRARRAQRVLARYQALSRSSWPAPWTGASDATSPARPAPRTRRASTTEEPAPAGNIVEWVRDHRRGRLPRRLRGQDLPDPGLLIPPAPWSPRSRTTTGCWSTSSATTSTTCTGRPHRVRAARGRADGRDQGPHQAGWACPARPSRLRTANVLIDGQASTSPTPDDVVTEDLRSRRMSLRATSSSWATTGTTRRTAGS